MVRIAPDVEIRGVVFAEVDPVSQHLLPAHGADHKIGGIRRGIVPVLVPLRGDACDRSLPVFGKIRRTRIAGSRREGNIGIIARAVVGGCGRRRAISEKGAAARKVAEAHRHQTDIRHLFTDSNGVTDSGCPAPDLDSRERDGAVPRGDPHLLPTRHRKVRGVLFVGYGIGRELRRGKCTHISVDVGNDIECIVPRKALEAQDRVLSVGVEAGRVVRAEEVEIHVADRRLVRCSGDRPHGFGMYLQFHRDRRQRS